MAGSDHCKCLYPWVWQEKRLQSDDERLAELADVCLTQTWPVFEMNKWPSLPSTFSPDITLSNIQTGSCKHKSHKRCNTQPTFDPLLKSSLLFFKKLFSTEPNNNNTNIIFNCLRLLFVCLPSIMLSFLHGVSTLSHRRHHRQHWTDYNDF